METELQKEYKKAIQFLQIQRIGGVGEIPIPHIDEHLEKNAGQYAFWGARLSEVECNTKMYLESFEVWLHRRLYEIKEELKLTVSKSVTITEKDCLGKLLSAESDKVLYEEYKKNIRDSERNERMLKTIVKAYELRGFHLMNLANRLDREWGASDSSKGRYRSNSVDISRSDDE